MKQYGIVSLAKLLPGWLEARVKAPEPPPKIVAPKPTTPKVIGDPTRTPVNKQSAMLITRAHHLELPPFPPAGPVKGEVEKLREENAALKAKNVNLVAENGTLKRKLELAQKKPKIEIKTVYIVEDEKPKMNESKRKLLERLELA